MKESQILSVFHNTATASGRNAAALVFDACHVGRVLRAVLFVQVVMAVALVLRAKGKAPATTTARLAELQARTRPYFLFNTLNSAIALVRAEPRKAERLLEDPSASGADSRVRIEVPA